MTEKTIKRKEEKTKPEKVLMFFAWTWSSLIFILSASLFLMGIDCNNPLSFTLYILLVFLLIIFLSFLFAIISRIKKNPKIHARYWLRTFAMTLVSFFFFVFIGWIIDNTCYYDYVPPVENGASLELGMLE